LRCPLSSPRVSERVRRPVQQNYREVVLDPYLVDSLDQVRWATESGTTNTTRSGHMTASHAPHFHAEAQKAEDSHMPLFAYGEPTEIVKKHRPF
jgi:hypothetical protein